MREARAPGMFGGIFRVFRAFLDSGGSGGLGVTVSGMKSSPWRWRVARAACVSRLCYTALQQQDGYPSLERDGEGPSGVRLLLRAGSAGHWPSACPVLSVPDPGSQP